MKMLHETAMLEEVKGRTAQLNGDSRALWGKMSVSQAVSHCAIALEVALGDQNPPRMLVGRVLGPIVKPLALGNDDPIKKNSPTAPIFVVTHEPKLEVEKERLQSLLDRFGKAGLAGCTKHPHVFFGPLTPEQWSILMYKHMDHHLRQFGV